VSVDLLDLVGQLSDFDDVDVRGTKQLDALAVDEDGRFAPGQDDSGISAVMISCVQVTGCDERLLHGSSVLYIVAEASRGSSGDTFGEGSLLGMVVRVVLARIASRDHLVVITDQHRAN
jgi:hypothetical protein